MKNLVCHSINLRALEYWPNSHQAKNEKTEKMYTKDCVGILIGKLSCIFRKFKYIYAVLGFLRIPRDNANYFMIILFISIFTLVINRI